MIRSRHISKTTSHRVFGVTLAVAVAVVTLTSVPAAAAPRQPSSAPAALLPTVKPALTTFVGERFADTRASGATIDGLFLGAGPVAAGSEYEVTIAGRGSVPNGAVAAVMNVAALGPDAPGFFTVYECDPARPTASALNYTTGVDVANEVVVKLSAVGSVCVYSFAGAGLLLDVVGYIESTDSIETMIPKRFAESRVGATTFDGLFEGFGRTAPGSTTTIQVANRDGLPPTISAAILNVGVVDPTSDGFVTVYSCQATVPTASSINHTAGVNRANELIVQPNASGEICIFTQRDVDLIVDVVGYVESGSDLISTPNKRYFESRPGATTFDGQQEGGGILAAGSTTTVEIGGRGVVPDDAVAVVANVAAVDPTAAGFFTVYPCVDPKPNSSSLNYTTGVNGANELIADLDVNGELCVFSSASTHLIVDVVGYVEPNADLSITKTDHVDPIAAGSALTYTIEVTNNGPHTATDVVVTDTLPAGVTLSATSGCVEDPNGVPTCSLGDLGAGASASYVVAVDIDSLTSGTITNTAEVSSGTGDPAPSNNSASEDTDVFLIGTIEIVKASDPAGGTGFGFTGDIGMANVFTLDDGQTETFASVEVGSYTVVETDPTPGYDLTALTCVDSDTGGTASSGDVPSRTATIELDPGETVTCTFGNVERGTIIVEKQTLPDGDIATFDFTGDAAGTIADDGTITVADLAPGTYTSTENVPAGWDLTDITCDDTNSTGNTGTATATFTLDPGETVTCTFTNTKLGTISIIKGSTPAGGTGFGYTDDIAAPNSFTLDDGQTETFTDVDPGSYTVVETDPTPGYDLTALTCVDSDTGGTASSGDVPSRTATIELDPGETVTCTFGNVERGTIIVEKQTLPDGDIATFDFTGDAAGTIADDGTITVADLAPGTYTSTENVPAGWDLTDITCDDTNSTGNTGTATATFTLDPGETVTCTFTNTKRGTIVVEKQTLPDGDIATFDFTGDAAGTIADDGTITVADLAPGTYTSTENVPAGWDLTDITCDDTNSTGNTGTATATFTLDPGETVTCTFTNTKLGTISIIKGSTPAGGTGFGYTDDIAAPNSFTLDDGQTETFTDVDPGSYTVVETDPTPGYDLTALTCVDSDTGGTASSGDVPSRTATIELDPGETVTCTFGNVERGTINIVKDADPNGPTDFGFTDDIAAPNAFSLDDDADGTLSNTETFTNVAPGQYTVTETDPTPGFDLTALTCVDSDTGGTASTGVVATRAATIELDPGETVTCTFGNVERGTINIVKDADPNGPTDFAYTDDIAAPNAFSLDDDADGTLSNTKTFLNVAPGQYTVTEDDPTPGFDLTDLTCVDSDTGGTASTGVVATRAATIELDPGETVTCTFGNVERGTINIVKDADPNGPTDFAYTDDIAAPNAFSLDDDADGTLSNTETFTNVAPGQYTVTETDPTPGFDLTALTCVDSDTGGTASTGVVATRAATIELDPGETVTCTYTNTQRGTINITKEIDPDHPQDFTFTDDIAAPNTFDLDDDADGTLPNTQTFTNVAPGQYTVTETDPTPGFDLTALTCVDSDTGGTASTGVVATRAATIELDPGETVTCTYTNTQRGTINITKEIDPDHPQDFTFTDDIAAPNTFDLDDDADGTLPNTQTFTNVAPGQYTVTETDPTPATLIGLTCVDSDTGGTASSVVLATRIATIELDPGETVTCTYTNSFNTPPILNLDANDSGGNSPDWIAAFSEGTAVNVTDTDVTITDTEQANMVSATATLTNPQDGAAESLASSACGAPLSVGGNAITLVITGNATKAIYEACLASVTYNNTSDTPTTTPDRTVTVVVNDGTVDSTTRTSTISVTATNDAPVLAAIEAAALAYTENDTAKQITNTITVADADDTNLVSALIQITGNYQNGQDILGDNGSVPVGITAGAFNAGAGSIALTGTATVTDYQTALRAITYFNNSNNPSELARTTTFTVNDGTDNSNTQTRDITVTATNDPPTIGANAYTTIGNVQLRVDDNPGGTVPTPTTPYLEAFPDQPMSNNTDPDSVLTAGAVTVNPTKGAVGVNADGTFLYTPNAGQSGADSFTFKVLEDAADNGATQTVNITIGGAVWFAKNNQAAGGVGRSNDPFDTLAEAETASSAGDTIFMYAGDGTTTGQTAGIGLKNNQQLIGEAAGLTLVDPNDSNQTLTITAVPASRPKISHAGVNNNGIDLANANTVRGLDITSAGETGIEMVKSSGTTTATIIGVGVSNTVEEGILFNLSGSATVTALVQGDGTTSSTCRFETTSAQGVDAVPVGSSTMNLTIDGCVFTDTNAADGAIKINPDGSASANATIKNNIFGPIAPAGPEIWMSNESSGTLEVTIDTNMASTSHVGRHVEVFHDDLGSGGAANGTTLLDIKNNTFSGATTFEGVFVDAKESVVNADVDVGFTVTNNIVAAPTTGFGDFFGSNAIFADARDNATICADITANTAVGGPFGAAAIAVQQFGVSVMQLEGLVGAAAAYLAAQNPSSAAPIGAGGGSITSAGACQLPAATPTP